MSHRQLESSEGVTQHIPELENTRIFTLSSQQTSSNPQPWELRSNPREPHELEMSTRIELDSNRLGIGLDASERAQLTTTSLSHPAELGTFGSHDRSAEADSSPIATSPQVPYELQTISATTTSSIKCESLPPQQQQRISSFPEPWVEFSSGVEHVPMTVALGVDSNPTAAASTIVPGTYKPQDAHIDRLYREKGKLRREKELLQKLQRLEDMEAEVQREIETREAELAGSWRS